MQVWSILFTYENNGIVQQKYEEAWSAKINMDVDLKKSEIGTILKNTKYVELITIVIYC